MGRYFPSKVRVVNYRVDGDLQGTAADRILTDAYSNCIITQFDVGRQFTWFEGPPGAELRSLRRYIEDIARSSFFGKESQKCRLHYVFRCVRCLSLWYRAKDSGLARELEAVANAVPWHEVAYKLKFVQRAWDIYASEGLK